MIKIGVIQNLSTPIDLGNVITYFALKLGLPLENGNVMFIHKYFESQWINIDSLLRMRLIEKVREHSWQLIGVIKERQEVKDVPREEPTTSQVQLMSESSAHYNQRGKRVRDQQDEEESLTKSQIII